MKINWKENRFGILFMALFSVIMFLIAFLANGTCDEGDSIFHYLYARFAWHHHELFFDHWAKPFFVLLASPFAQFGFIGIKVFNTLLTCISMWFTYLMARQMNYKLAPLVFVIGLFFRTFLVVTFSGLT